MCEHKCTPSRTLEDRHNLGNQINNKIKSHKKLGIIALSDNLGICKHGGGNIQTSFNNVNLWTYSLVTVQQHCSM